MLAKGVVEVTRTRIVGAAVAGLMVLFLLVPATAGAGDVHYRRYRGHTSQGDLVTATTYVQDGTRHAVIDFVSMTLDCEDGTQVQWPVPFIVPMPSGETFGIDDVSFSQAAHLDGRLGVHMGSGTVTFSVPGLTADEQAMLCTAGDLTWRVRRIDEGARPIVP
jgi:hypothetical protein